MAALEREGFLQQPHTSAGRIPTDRGYRFFVDRLSFPTRLGPAQQQDVRTFFDKTSGELEGMLHETSRLLTRLTGAASVVVGPDHDTTTVKSFQLVSISARTAVGVVVYSNGHVEKRTLEVDDVSEHTVKAASFALMKTLEGKALRAKKSVPTSGQAEVDSLCSKVLTALQSQHDEMSDHVFVGGASRLAGSFEAAEVVSNVLTVLEQQYIVVTLIRDLLDRGINVSIGAENSLQSLAQCSLIVAPTIVDGEQRGSVAILGPTRMDYSGSMAAVAVVSQRLSERLGS